MGCFVLKINNQESLSSGGQFDYVGSKIKEIRISKRLKISELSAITGLSNSLISQVERDQVSPSISSLRKIAQAMEVGIVDLFDNNSFSKGHVVRKNKRKKLSIPESKITYELLNPSLSSSVIEFLVINIEPDSKISEELFSHPGDEVALVLEGKVEVYLGDEIYTLQEGDSIAFKCSTPHKIENMSTKRAVMITAITPPHF